VALTSPRLYGLGFSSLRHRELILNYANSEAGFASRGRWRN
jgi:hypothetical protein